MHSTLFLSTALGLAISSAAYGSVPQSCGMSQAQLNSLAQSNWGQVQGDNDPECGLNGSGPAGSFGQNCQPPSFLPGDVLPGDGSSVTDAQGNTWSLFTPAQSGSGNWYGGIVFNGQQADTGYWAALRLVNGQVYGEQAKGSGWVVLNASNPGDMGNVLRYVGDPGPSGSCSGDGGSSVSAAPPAPQPTGGVAATIPAYANRGGQSNLAPFADPTCPTQAFNWQATASGAVTPGSGSFSANGKTYSINANNGDVASVNGAPINQGAYQTSQFVQGSDGNLYGQDENSGQWFQLNGIGSNTWWQPLSSEPEAILPTATSNGTSASTGSGPLNTQKTFSQQLGYFEATVAAGGTFSLVGNDGTTIQVGQSTDDASHVYGIDITAQTTRLYVDAAQVSQIATPADYQQPLHLEGTNVESARAFTNMEDALACVPNATAPTIAAKPSDVSPVTSLGPALSLAGGMTTSPRTVTPVNTIGGNQ